MLIKLYCIYQNSPKLYHGLKELSKAFKKMITKPSKVHGMWWFDHKYHAMEWVLENSKPEIAYSENLCYSDSQALKRAELEGQAKKWKEPSYHMYMVIYLNILSPIHRISIAMQKDFHEPMKVVKKKSSGL